MSKTQLPHRQMVKSHVSETWSVLVRVQSNWGSQYLYDKSDTNLELLSLHRLFCFI